jgi:hypothetical protein
MLKKLGPQRSTLADRLRHFQAPRRVRLDQVNNSPRWHNVSSPCLRRRHFFVELLL